MASLLKSRLEKNKMLTKLHKMMSLKNNSRKKKPKLQVKSSLIRTLKKMNQSTKIRLTILPKVKAKKKRILQKIKKKSFLGDLKLIPSSLSNFSMRPLGFLICKQS